VRSLSNLRGIELGFDADGLVLVDMAIDGAGGGFFSFGAEYESAWPPNEVARIYEAVEERLAGIPGASAALINPTPFYLEVSISFEVPGLDSLPTDPAGGPFRNKLLGGQSRITEIAQRDDCGGRHYRGGRNTRKSGTACAQVAPAASAAENSREENQREDKKYTGYGQ
jgi:hypothetical protein